MQTLINLYLSLTGKGKMIWDFLDGLKTFLLCLVAALSGILGLLQEIIPILSAHDAGALYGWFCALPHDQAYQMVVGSGIVAALRHAVAKGPTVTPDPALAADTSAGK